MTSFNKLSSAALRWGRRSIDASHRKPTWHDDVDCINCGGVKTLTSRQSRDVKSFTWWVRYIIDIVFNDNGVIVQRLFEPNRYYMQLLLALIWKTSPAFSIADKLQRLIIASCNQHSATASVNGKRAGLLPWRMTSYIASCAPVINLRE